MKAVKSIKFDCLYFYNLFIDRLKKHRISLITSITVGLCAYFYVFTNKLINLDEVFYLFGVGATLTSGRWGLELLSYILPNYSMPWFCGILTLLIMSVSVCMILDLFKIESKLFQIVLSGVIISFPSLIGNYTFMFTCCFYAIAFFLTVLAVRLAEKGGALNTVLSIAVLTFSVAIYQAYITIASGLFIVLAIGMLIKDDCTAKKVLLRILKYVLILAAAVGIYFLITIALMAVFDISLNRYAIRQSTSAASPILGIINTYKSFAAILLHGKMGLVNTKLSLAAHALFAVCAFIALVINQIKKKSIIKTVILAVLIILLPLSINAFTIINSFVHTLMLYGFIVLYLLGAIVLEANAQKNKYTLKNLAGISLAIIILSNVYVANRCYLQLHLTYENTYAYYQSMVTQIKMTPGFDRDSKLVIIGTGENMIYDGDNFPKSDIFGVDSNIINEIAKESFIKYYIGFDIEFASWEETERLMKSDEVGAMPEYPYYGSICKIDNYIVVKLGPAE